MTEFAALASADREEILLEAADRLGVSALIVEKDFWVCWTLGVLFGDESMGPNLMFKGGTSLSMVFGAIHRFSEDIDLALPTDLFGVDEADLNEAPTNTQRRKRMERLNASCAGHVEHQLRDRLTAAITKRLGSRKLPPSAVVYEFNPATGSPDLKFEYPSVVRTLGGYIQKQVKLEFGSLTNQRPRGRHRASSLLSRAFPGAHEDAHADVIALEVERTFWEKATILHSEAGRPLAQPMRDRFARHYSDFAALWRHSSRAAAMDRLDLLADVALHKSRFFGSPWASYETAKPGSFRLVPPESRIAELRSDYTKMRPMFLVEPEPFDQLLSTLREAEQEINAA